MMSASSTPLPGKEFVLSVADRRAAGRALRKEMPRSSHAEWSPVADRPDPISLLEEQNVSRQAQLVPIRYGRMAASPLILLRSAVTWGEAIGCTATTGRSSHQKETRASRHVGSRDERAGYLQIGSAFASSPLTVSSSLEELHANSIRSFRERNLSASFF